MKRIKFRNAILGSFLIFIVFMLLIFVQVMLIHSEEDRLRLIETSIKKINDTNILIYKAEQDFLSNDLINPTFYQNGSSRHLVQLTMSIEQNIDLIEQSIASKSLQKFSIDSLAMELNKAVIIHNKILLNLVKYQKLRGFKDYGTEGKMRTFIHKLESTYPEVDKIQVLTMRRTEKDYLLRKDSAYTLQMTKHYYKFIKTIQSYKKGNKEEIKALIKGYYDNFIIINEIEQIIGVNNNTGLRAQLKTTYDKSETILNKMLTIAQSKTKERTQYLFLFLQCSMGFLVILSLIVALILSSTITEPIVQLSQKMVDASNNRYKSWVDIKSRSKIKEVGILEEKFLHLMNDIGEQLDLINQKSNKMEEYNAELEAINDLMSKTNQKLRVSEASLIKSMSVKEKFLAIVSHDVRSPLATLKGYLNILTLYPESIPEEKKIKTLIDLRNSVDLQLNLLTNMMEWARSQMEDIKVTPEVISLIEISNNTFKLLRQSAIAKNITLKNKIKDYALHADRNMLELVLRNLISNAIKFTHTDGTIVLSSKKVDAFNIKIIVKDNGVGISPENLKLLMKTDEHFTLEGTNHEKGTGFGLLFCKEFIEKNGGQMTIESELGSGTEVAFTIKRIKQKKVETPNLSTKKAHTLREFAS